MNESDMTGKNGESMCRLPDIINRRNHLIENSDFGNYRDCSFG